MQMMLSFPFEQIIISNKLESSGIIYWNSSGESEL